MSEFQIILAITILSSMSARLRQDEHWNPNELRRLKDEICGSFKTSGEITSTTLANLPYLTAVLEETLRLYPPLPVALPRLVPEGGGEISGYKVPSGVSHESHRAINIVSC